jgi:hypothetical protein
MEGASSIYKRSFSEAEKITFVEQNDGILMRGKWMMGIESGMNASNTIFYHHHLLHPSVEKIHEFSLRMKKFLLHFRQ